MLSASSKIHESYSVKNFKLTKSKGKVQMLHKYSIFVYVAI